MKNDKIQTAKLESQKIESLRPQPGPIPANHRSEFISAQSSIDEIRDEYDRKLKLLNDNFFRALTIKKQQYDSSIRDLTMSHISDSRKLNEELELKLKELKVSYVDLL